MRSRTRPCLGARDVKDGGTRQNYDVGRRTLVGSLVALLAVAILSGIMFPLRGHVSSATAALILVLPVVLGVAVGGLVAGVVAVTVGFASFYVWFTPPHTRVADTAENWVALGVYISVMGVTAIVVSRLDRTRREAQDSARETRRLFEMSELLVSDRSMDELMRTIVVTVRDAFDFEGVTLLLPVHGRLERAASDGSALADEDLRRFSSPSGTPVRMGTDPGTAGSVRAVALAASGRPVGLLVVQGPVAGGVGRDQLRTLANHLALALERAQLREQVVRAELLEEMDRIRRGMVGAVSHDLRTPLASIKAAASSISDPNTPLTSADTSEMANLIDLQADRLDRLVSNLLDMTRVQAGSFELRREPTSLALLVTDALGVLGPSVVPSRVEWRSDEPTAVVDVDQVLAVQVLANLLENAARHAPEGSRIEVESVHQGDELVKVTVTDRGPGIPKGEQDTVFEMFNRREAGGRAGLGLAIARAFLEAHGQDIWLEDVEGGGTRLAFTLPVAVAAHRG